MNVLLTNRPFIGQSPDMAPQPVAREKLDEVGVETLCDWIADGDSLTKIATRTDVRLGSLLTWIAADPVRSARVDAARMATGWHWDEKAEHTLESAKLTKAALTKARELASHYRWRARMVNPRYYGERVDLRHTGAVLVGHVPIDPEQLSDEQREVIRDVLLISPPIIEHEPE